MALQRKTRQKPGKEIPATNIKITKVKPLQKQKADFSVLSSCFEAGIGIGAAAFIGIVLLLSGGCKNGSPKQPTEIELVGEWKSEGTSYKDSRTYTGIYDFYAIGNHTYDIIISDGVHKKGRGVWTLTKETHTLQVKNDTGSEYVGTFQGGIFTTIALTTTNKQWGLVLKKKEGSSTSPAER